MAVDLSSKTLAYLMAHPSDYAHGFTVKEITAYTHCTERTTYNHLKELRKAGFVKDCAKLITDPTRRAVYLDKKALEQYSPPEPGTSNNAVGIHDASVLIDMVGAVDNNVETILAIVTKLAQNGVSAAPVSKPKATTTSGPLIDFANWLGGIGGRQHKNFSEAEVKFADNLRAIRGQENKFEAEQFSHVEANLTQLLKERNQESVHSENQVLQYRVICAYITIAAMLTRNLEIDMENY